MPPYLGERGWVKRVKFTRRGGSLFGLLSRVSMLKRGKTYAADIHWPEKKDDAGVR